MSLEELLSNLDEDATSSTVPNKAGDVDKNRAMADVAVKKLKATFTDVTEMFDQPHDWFDRPEFYKNVLDGEGDLASSVHKNLTGFLKAKDSADKSAFKGRLIPLFWELHKQVMGEILDDNFSLEKKLFLRYGALLPQLLSAEHRKSVSSIFLENRVDEAVWYCDEWVAMVAKGEVNPLATDEAPLKKDSGNAAMIAKIKTQIEKASGKKEALVISLGNLQQERDDLNYKLQNLIKIVTQQETSLVDGISMPLNDGQKRALTEFPLMMKSFAAVSKTIQNDYRELMQCMEQLRTQETQLARVNSGGNIVNTGALTQEAGQIHSLARMAVGRQGNQFPILAGQYFHSDLRFIATRENIVKVMKDVETIDEQIFKREFRRQVNRVPPHVIIVPCYGNSGVCWEPYERANKATSRGRIAVPMFSQDVRVAVITALGMLRWETAKEMAAHYWMDEGITGQYYQWFNEQKLRGDLRAHFVANYVLWITAESEGMQKLEREVRGIFWRNMPFSEERRENLRKRGFVYEDLYKKDLNRQSSAGY